MTTRRTFLAAGLAGPLAAAQGGGLTLGVMDGVLRQSTKPEALAVAKSFAMPALQVTLGRPAADGRLPLEDPALQARYVAEARRQGVVIDATYLDVLHVNCLKDDELARTWVRKGIEITRKLNARILMTVFFGKCALGSRQEIDAAADAFKELAREAEKADVVLGFENLLTAEDNARAMDRVGSRAFKIYYDAGNATNMVGVDAIKEIRWLGRDRICQFHFKDQGYLGEGKVDYPAVLRAISDIGFRGYANLETSAPSGNWESDLKRNIAYLNGLMK
ncbi:MAG: sugar phosphate isomerase/epimerase [Acidobacteria bacterium]|nr:sugar phosphate isomerase/epimerase [Acidobacteriota bacterium]